MSNNDRRDFLKLLATTVGAVSVNGSEALGGQPASPQSQDQSAEQAEVLATCAQPQSRAERGAPLVEVSHTDRHWIVAGRRQQFALHEATLALTITAQGVVWHMVPSARGDLLLQRDGRETAVRLADAKRIEIHAFDTGYKTGVRLTLSHWLPDSVHADPDAKLYLTACIEGPDDDIVFDVIADELGSVVRQVDWPAAMDGSEVDLTVLSNSRGNLLPRNWPQVYSPIRVKLPDGQLDPKDISVVESNLIECWSMSWWGFQKGNAAMMLIVETPNDAAYQFNHPAGGPTVIGPRWRHTLGRFRYPRRLRMCFFAKGNYVTLAKRYRAYMRDSGNLVLLKEKIYQRPIVKKLIGAPLTRQSILMNVKVGSNDYEEAKRRGRPVFELHNFRERGEQFRLLKSQGLQRLTVCLTGWPRCGYDRQHPDELPPTPAAGGWEGMQQLQKACNELGYLFTLHDQYRDYHLHAPSYNPEFALHEETSTGSADIFPGTRFGGYKKGRLAFINHWSSGVFTYMSPWLQLGHMEKNYRAMFAHGIRPDGVYLDVFGYVPPDQDFNPHWPSTRADSMRQRAACCKWGRENLGVVGTEAGADWILPYVDFTAPEPQGQCIPAPLYELVYHDAVLTPYSPRDLYGVLAAGLPETFGDELAGGGSVHLRTMCDLNERLALKEMVNHEYLTQDRKSERTTFADGTTVTMDWESKKFRVTG